MELTRADSCSRVYILTFHKLKITFTQSYNETKLTTIKYLCFSNLFFNFFVVDGDCFIIFSKIQGNFSSFLLLLPNFLYSTYFHVWDISIWPNLIILKSNLCLLLLNFKTSNSHHDMSVIPRDLSDLLSDSKSEEWVPRFREYLANLDQKGRPGRPWRVNRLDLLLKLRELTSLRDRIASSSSEEEKENLDNEKDVKFEQIR